MQVRDAPEKYWDFAVELATEYINHIATRKLGWRTPYEYHFGDTLDVSVFHFLFFAEIHYLEPNAPTHSYNIHVGMYQNSTSSRRNKILHNPMPSSVLYNHKRSIGN